MGIEYPVVGGKLDGLSASTYRIDEIRPLIYLLVCRDAYWKIAGEQIGLDKPWEPDWRNINEDKYCIEISNQILASIAILKRANIEILEAHLNNCVVNAETQEEKEEKMLEVSNILKKVIK